MVNGSPISFSGHAYPWDVLGDPAFARRVADLGLTRVTLAAVYHSVRAATPLHPQHQLVNARHAALYRPVREAVWRGRRLRPLAPDWTSSSDPFRTAAAALHKAGLDVSAWIVLSHNSRLGTQFPRLSVVNCFGDRYPYALCPAQEEGRDYAAILAAEAIHDVLVDAVSLEACGQLGVVHAGHHDKTDGAWTPHAQRILSVCCCDGCRSGWSGAGLDPDRVIADLRAALHCDLDPALAAALLKVRHAATDRLRHQVLAAVREKSVAIEITLHAHPDPWVTGASPGMTATAAHDVDAVIVPAWPTTTATAQLVADAVTRAATVDAYLTVLAPTDTDAVLAHARRLVAAGARRLSLYHLALAPHWRQPVLAQLTSALVSTEGTP